MADQQEELNARGGGATGGSAPAEPSRLVKREISMLMLLAALVTGILAEICITQVNATYEGYSSTLVCHKS